MKSVDHISKKDFFIVFSNNRTFSKFTFDCSSISMFILNGILTNGISKGIRLDSLPPFICAILKHWLKRKKKFYFTSFKRI